METYRELFCHREFRVLFGLVCARNAGTTMTGIALGTLALAQTGSPLLSALGMFGSSFGQAVGAATLLSFADRLRPRRTLAWIGGGYAAATVLLAHGVTVGWLLTVVLTSGLVGALNGGVQWGLVREAVPDCAYLLSRSAFTVSAGLMQVLGFGIGGLLVQATGSRTTLLVAAGLHAASGVAARLGLPDRPPRSTGHASVRTTWQVNRRLLSAPECRVLMLALWVPTGLVVGCESLFIPYSPRWAGLLLSAAALGMLGGDVLVARARPQTTRPRLADLLRLLLAGPYLLFAVSLPLALAVVAVVAASTGYAASLLLQERLLALTPEGAVGHVLGLHNAGMLALQAVGATLAGLVAEVLPPSTTIAVLATASLAVTLALTPHLGTRNPRAARPTL